MKYQVRIGKSSKSFLSSPPILMELGKKTQGADWLALLSHVWARVLFFLSSEARGPAFSPYLLQLMQPTYLKVGKIDTHGTLPVSLILLINHNRGIK